MLQDRATASFTSVISIPPLKVAAEFHLHRGDSGLWVYAEPDAPEREVVVPPDFYLREVHEIVAWDHVSIAAFIEAWGFPVDLLNRDLLGGESGIDHDAERVNLTAGISLDEGRESAAVELGWVHELPKGQGFAATARALSDPTRAAKVQRLVNWDEVLTRVYLMQYIASEIADPGGTADLPDALNDLNAALSIFAPRVTVNGATPPQPTIYNVFAAQIANDIYEGTTLMKCQNERCLVTFTKQRGRAEYGAHRTKGVLYCSNSCAKAVAQRALRLRRRIAKNDA